MAKNYITGFHGEGEDQTLGEREYKEAFPLSERLIGIEKAGKRLQ